MKILLIDGNSLICRACFAKGAPLTSATGEPTHGTYFFTRTLLRLLRSTKPDMVAVAKDERRAKTFRRILYPAYKLNRKAHHEGLDIQLKRSFQIVKALGLPVVYHSRMEADDVIASLVDIYRNVAKEVVIAGVDKDLDQLLGGSVVRMDPYSEDVFDEHAVKRKYGLTPSQLIDYQTLVGDSGDNVPGVRGVGPKTAKSLLRTFGTYQSIASAIRHGNVCGSAATKIQAALNDGSFHLMRSLVMLRTDLDFQDLSPEDLEFSGVDMRGASGIFRALGFRRWD